MASGQMKKVAMDDSSVSTSDASKVAGAPAADLDENLSRIAVRFRLPNAEIMTLDISGLESLYIRDLKQKLSQEGCPIPASKMKLVFKHRGIEDRELIGDVCLQDGDLVFIVLSTTHREAYYPKYDDFILITNPKHLAVNVPVDAVITVSLKMSSMNQAIYTNALMSDCPVRSLRSGNMVANLLNDTTMAEDRGYRQWTKAEVAHSQVLLLQVADDLDLRLNDLRYDVSGINAGYDGGDMHSWQRYTKSMPIECTVLVSHFNDAWPHSIRVQPADPLAYNTQYALLLANNVPVVSATFPHYSVEFFSECIGDDKLIIFKTEKKPKGPRVQKSSPPRQVRHAVLL